MEILDSNKKNSIIKNSPKVDSLKLAEMLITTDLTVADLAQVLSTKKMNEVEHAVYQYIQKDIRNVDRYAELYPNGKYMQNISKYMEQKEQENNEDKMWQACVGSNNIKNYENYLKFSKLRRYVEEAEEKIEKLRRIQINEEEERKKREHKERINKYLEELREDPNKYSFSDLKAFGLDEDDLRGIIPDLILDNINDESITLDLGDSPLGIPSGYTEVYFWGIPGSGKTCVLSAIMSRGCGYYKFNIENIGGDYARQLSGIFYEDSAILPDATPHEKTQYLPFTIEDEQGNKHKIALIEISGEIFECFALASDSAYAKRVCPEFLAQKGDKYDTYMRLLGYLQDDKNPKFHFFIVDTTKKTEVRSVKYTQKQLLESAAKYMSQNNIFNKRTSGIHCIATKCDVYGDSIEQQEKAIRDKLHSKEFNSFTTCLHDVLVSFHIIRKKDKNPILPFSIGVVYLQNRCIFNPKYTDKIIKILQKETSRVQGKQLGKKTMHR